MQVIGGIMAFIVLCILVGRAVYVGFDAFGHLLWIVPVVLIAGLFVFLQQSNKGIYK